jgi:hypothetical protein
MSRWVVPAHAGLKSAGPRGQPDGAAARVVKYVPAEVVSAYTVFSTALSAFNLPDDQGAWFAEALISFFFLVTIGYVYNQTNGAIRRAHLLVSPLSFLAWAYPISSTLLGEMFVPLVGVILQVLVIGLAIVIAPSES